MIGEVLARLHPDEAHVRITPAQQLELRAVADHVFRAGEIHVQEGGDILLHRDAPDVERDRARIRQEPLLSYNFV